MVRAEAEEVEAVEVEGEAVAELVELVEKAAVEEARFEDVLVGEALVERVAPVEAEEAEDLGRGTETAASADQLDVADSAGFEGALVVGVAIAAAAASAAASTRLAGAAPTTWASSAC